MLLKRGKPVLSMAFICALAWSAPLSPLRGQEAGGKKAAPASKEPAAKTAMQTADRIAEATFRYLPSASLPSQAGSAHGTAAAGQKSQISWGLVLQTIPLNSRKRYSESACAFSVNTPFGKGRNTASLRPVNY